MSRHWDYFRHVLCLLVCAPIRYRAWPITPLLVRVFRAWPAQGYSLLAPSRFGHYRRERWKSKLSLNSRAGQNSRDAAGTFVAGQDRLCAVSVRIASTLARHVLVVSPNRKRWLWCPVVLRAPTSETANLKC